MIPPDSMLSFADIEHAYKRIYATGLVERTPLLKNRRLNEATGAKILVKAENLQSTGSFKIRGATNRIAKLSSEERQRGVVAFSSGNHAQGIARAAKYFDVQATIIMPSDAPAIKVEGVKRDGGTIVEYDRERESREEIAEQFSKENGSIIIPSYDDPDIIAGQGTVGLELVQQLTDINHSLDHLIVCTGGGGLAAGIALAFKKLSPKTKIWVAEPDGYDDWKRSLQSGTIKVNTSWPPSLCDSILTKSPGDLPWKLASELIEGGLSVTDEEVKVAIRFAISNLKIVLEPGGAVALATALRGLPTEMQGTIVGVIATGGNIDSRLLAKILSEQAQSL